MKLLPLLLILISCGSTDKPMEYFHPMGTDLYCKYLTHDNMLKDCHDPSSFNAKTEYVINAVNIVKVYR